MELKDVILSTLAEMEEEESVKQPLKESATLEKPSLKTQENTLKQPKQEEEPTSVASTHLQGGELYFLNSIRERLLVLFEGFQAPNNANIEAKVDMTLNFLEYTLATIDDRIEKLEKGVSN